MKKTRLLWQEIKGYIFSQSIALMGLEVISRLGIEEFFS